MKLTTVIGYVNFIISGYIIGEVGI